MFMCVHACVQKLKCRYHIYMRRKRRKRRGEEKREGAKRARRRSQGRGRVGVMVIDFSVYEIWPYRMTNVLKV